VEAPTEEISQLAVDGYRQARTKDHTAARVLCNREVTVLRAFFCRMVAYGLFDGGSDSRSRTQGLQQCRPKLLS